MAPVCDSVSDVTSNIHLQLHTSVCQCWDLAWIVSLEGTARHS